MRTPLYNILTALFVVVLQPFSTLSGQSSGENGKIKWTLPVKIPLFLSGNFGEPRSNHFHSGIDIKTGGATGVPVYAVCSGSVSRIKVEPGGYGRALYMKHPGGYTSVFAHLSRFPAAIERYVKDEQYRRESFSVDLFPEPDRFVFNQGEVVAWSGNSGSSEGPHLHFEIRETASENPVNPLTGVLSVADKIPPVLSRIYSYSLSGRKEWIQPVSLALTGLDGRYQLSTGTTLPVDQTGGLGIETWDLLDGSANHCGVYRIQASLDGELFFDLLTDEFAFSETRYLNSFIDYKTYINSGKRVLRLFVEPNNRLSLYRFSKNNGKIELADQSAHEVRLVIEDAAGNRSEATVMIVLDPGRFKREPDFEPVYSAYFSYGETNEFSADGINLRIPAAALYDNIYFQYQADGALPGCYSLTHTVHRPDVPLHQYIRIAILPIGLPGEFRNQALIARIEEDGKMTAVGGTWEGNFLVARTRSFGRYTIRIDTIKPQVRPGNFKTPEDLRGATSIRFIVKDDGSGIGNYRGEVDGQWALVEYDPKNSLMEYTIDPGRIGTGKAHSFVLQVTDQVKHTSYYRTMFYR